MYNVREDMSKKSYDTLMIYRCLDEISVKLVKKIIKSVLILFEENIFDETQD